MRMKTELYVSADSQVNSQRSNDEGNSNIKIAVISKEILNPTPIESGGRIENN